MIVAFEQAHYRLNHDNLDFKEFTSLKKIANDVLEYEQLRECASKLCGKTKIIEAAALSEQYTMIR